MAGAADARRHLQRLAAEPRPAGSAAESAARRYCTEQLSALGFQVRDEPFSYSTIPGRYATSLAGGLAIVLLLVAAHQGAIGRSGTALGVLVVGGGALAVAAAWLARYGVLSLRWGRARSANLVAERGTPRLWLVAHLDSKSQPVPILIRALGIIVMLIVWIAALGVALLQSGGSAVEGFWPWISLLGVLAGIPVAVSLVGGRSPGALDNASGMAAALMTAAALPRELAAGVLITSAEELGLAGARAWVRRRGPATAINFDGVDDIGVVRLSYTGREPLRLVQALREEAVAGGVVLRAGHLVPGVLVDGVALADAGWEVVTVSRGTARTVARIHTPRDTVDRMTAQGIAELAPIVARAVTRLHPASD